MPDANVNRIAAKYPDPHLRQKGGNNFMSIVSSPKFYPFLRENPADEWRECNG
jgi:hypothetical protein